MKNLKLLKIFASLLLMLFFVACDKEEQSIDESSQKQDVVFDITNFIPSSTSNKGTIAAKNDDTIPDCSEETPDYVAVTIEGFSTYILNLVTLNDGMETEVLKLSPGIHTIEDFVVYDDNNTPSDTSDDVPIYASPMNGSYYQSLWGLDGVQKDFVVDAFQKRKVSIDVLCYEPFDYVDFGFAWFQYAKYKVKTVCFFGDICTELFEEWHEGEANPYLGQDYDGYDFAAIFEVEIKNAEGNIINDIENGANSNIHIQGVGAPLCVEYIDAVAVENETFTAEIYVILPDGTKELVHTESFDENTWSGANAPVNFGGEDGVFNFGVGCTNAGNDINLPEISLEQPVEPATIGQFRDGGVVFWVDPLDNTKGLVCAIGDQSESATWGCMGLDIVGADGQVIGTGFQNTLDILAMCPEPGTAAEICANLVLNGHDDWFLPSLEELNQMHVNRELINSNAIANGGNAFLLNYYWSSTEVEENLAISKNLGFVGQLLPDLKLMPRSVRAVRAF